MNHIIYLVPATLLYEAAERLQPPEEMGLVTGFSLAPNLRVLTGLWVLRYKEASRVHVEPDPASLLEAQRWLWDLGLDVEGQFHSHPGTEASATLHSSIDDATARRWENGAPFIGAVFSEGGRYVRFFNHEQKSTVIVYGNLKEIETNCFELPSIAGRPLPAAKSRLLGRWLHGSAGAV